ncbi:MAG: lamin tail domain-containing protein [bacterium]
MKYLAAIFVLLGVPLLGSAQAPPAVIINEIMWDGVEYVELLNTGEVDVVLDGWALTRQQAGGETKTIIQFDEGDVIAAGGYFLLERDEEATTASADKIASALTLVNTGELIILLDDIEQVVNQANQLGAWLAGENTEEGISMEWGGDGWHTSTGNAGGRAGTPREANSEVAAPEVQEEEEEYSDEIVINEFLPNPVGADAEGEFIELKNMGEAEVDLKDWQLDDMEGGSGAYVIAESVPMGADEIVVFWRSETGLALNNERDEVRLFSPDGEEKAKEQYSESVKEGWARARDEEGVWQWTVASTPGEVNIIILPMEEEALQQAQDEEYSDAIVVNEFLPNPVGSDTEKEFVELKNMGEEEIKLEGWGLDDGEGGSGKYNIPAGESLAAGGIKVFWRPDTKIALNNGGDEVRLFSPSGEIKASYVYEESVDEGLSYNRIENGDYVLSTTITPGEENVITEPVSEDGEGDGDDPGAAAGITVTKVLLKDIRSQAIGTIVETEGVVSAPPGVLGDKIMYLAGSGIQVYFYREEYPELEAGDKVRVRGELAASLGEYRIKLTAAGDVAVIGEGVAPEPHRVTTGEVGEGLEGSLVVIAGRVARTSGDTFFVDDGSGEVKVFIKKTTGIDKPKMKKGAVVTVMGVVSRTNTGYRILPRWQQDVRLGLVAGLASFPGAGWLYPSFGGAFLVAVLMLVLAWRAKEPLFNT